MLGCIILERSSDFKFHELGAPFPHSISKVEGSIIACSQGLVLQSVAEHQVQIPSKLPLIGC
jgi:hypothetical protein